MSGTGGPEHKEIVEFLERKYGKTTDITYTIDNLQSFACKNSGFKCDYVGQTSKCNAWVDVVVTEGWNSTLGKFIVLANQAKKDGKEAWIVVDIETLYKKHHNEHKYCDMKEPAFIEFQIKWCRLLYKLAGEVFSSEAISRIKIYNFNRSKHDKLETIVG